MGGGIISGCVSKDNKDIITLWMMCHLWLLVLSFCQLNNQQISTTKILKLNSNIIHAITALRGCVVNFVVKCPNV